MVLKGQIFSADAVFSFVVITIIIFCTFVQSGLIIENSSESFNDFKTMTKLIQASELLITNSEKGLAIYENNEVKHHEIDILKLDGIDKDKLLLENYDICITIENYFENCEHFQDKITRFVLCGGKVCKVEISAVMY